MKRGLGRRQRGFALVVVLFSVGVATAALVLLQASAFRQAIAGREALGQVRAYWAARSGLEATISRLSANTEVPDTTFAYATIDDMAEVSSGNVFREWDELSGTVVARWSIEHFDGESLFEGPADAHSKVNINRMTIDDLLALEGMTEDVAAAIVDWIDPDELVSEFGAEAGYYRSLDPPVQPRNAQMRTIEELELVAGVDASLVRGEDWNLNGRLDPNEDDGDTSWPPDNEDGVLDAGWSGIVTTESIDGGLAVSGRERVYLPAATAAELSTRIEALEALQARALIAAGNAAVDQRVAPGVQPNGLEVFLRQTLPTLAAETGEFSAIEIQQIAPLDPEQLRDVFAELTLDDPELGPRPGKVNLNLVRREVFDYVTLTREDPGTADRLVFLRDSQPGGFTSIVDLLDVAPPQFVAEYYRHMDVRSVSFVVTSRGVDVATGIEREIVATIDRTRLPIVISEMRVR